MKQTVKLEVNGDAAEVAVEPRETLLDVLRDHLGLTGAHAGCEHGACGACTVLFDGQPVRACLLFAVQCEGHTVTTIEAFGRPDALHPMMAAFRHDLDHILDGVCRRLDPYWTPVAVGELAGVTG